MGIFKGTRQKLSRRPTDRSLPANSTATATPLSASLTDNENIDENNSATLYFKIFGVVPQNIRLFVYGELFNQNFYTELGEHNHTSGSLSSGNATGTSVDHNHADLVHNHSFSLTADEDDAAHNHAVRVAQNDPDLRSISVDDDDFGYVEQAQAGLGADYLDENFAPHTHDISGDIEGAVPSTLATTSGLDDHAHNITSGNTSDTGVVLPVGSITTISKDYFDDLQIWINGINRTAILAAQVGTAKFGDGTAGHSIVTTGFELNLKSFITAPGEHKIEFILGGSQNGGKLRYNLYLTD